MNTKLPKIQQLRDEATGKTWQSLGVQMQVTEADLVLRFPYPADEAQVASQVRAVLGEEQGVRVSSQIASHAVKEGLKPIPGIKNIIAVGSGKGGVGKSTVSVNLALALRKAGAKVGLLDADIYGPSLPYLMGTQKTQAEVVQKQLLPVEVHGIPTMSIGYLVSEGTPMVWRGPMISSALKQLLYDTQWPELDYLIVDMPPGTGDIQLTLTQKMPVTAAVIVTTPQQVACADAKKALAMFQKVDTPVLGVVENMSYHQCPACGHESHLFGSNGGEALAQTDTLPLLGRIPLDAAICAQSDAGQPCHVTHTCYQDIAHQVACALACRPKDYSIGIPKIVLTS